MNTRQIYFLMCCLCLLCADGKSQVTTVVFQVTASGGGTTNAGPYALSFTIGQPFVGENLNGGTMNAVGFWNMVDHSQGSSIAATFTVTTVADAGVGSLRWAIDSANSIPGLTLIKFNIPDTVVHTIALATELPIVTRSVFIDGYSQPGARKNTLPVGDNAKLLIVLDGSAMSEYSFGLRMMDGPSTIRGLVINHFQDGIVLNAEEKNTGTVVAGNFIGTDPSGSASSPNGTGVVIQSYGNLIGGISPWARNIISGNITDGINFYFGSHSVVQGNYIGTTATGTSGLGNGQDGILIDGPNNLIGGSLPGAGNVIAFNGTDSTPSSASNRNGIAFGSLAGNRVWGNSIFSNYGLGIDLKDGVEDSFGVTANDSCDADAGVNGLQNYPELASAITIADTTIVRGSLAVIPHQTYRVEFFANQTSDSSQHGEGRIFLGFRNLSSGDSCTLSFAEPLSPGITPGSFITATATDSAGNTSEFSNAVSVVRGVYQGPGIIMYSRGGNSGGSIWVASTIGTFDTMLFAGSWPGLSHSGRYMLYHPAGGGSPNQRDIYYHDLQSGSNSLFFSNPFDYTNYYAWSNDDSTIIFDFDCFFYSQRVGGPRSQWPTTSCYDDAPSFRPGAWTIAFHNAYEGILLQDSAGANRRHVPNTGGGHYWPAWSPDGEWIAFEEWSDPLTSVQNFYKIHPDGSNLTPLTSFAPADSVAFVWGGIGWTPDGSKILVPGAVRGVNGIYAVATDGSKGIGRFPISAGDPVDLIGAVTGNVNVILTAMAERKGDIPRSFRLEQNFPNPFNPSTVIRYDLPKGAYVTLKIYNVIGQEILTLVNEHEEAGFRSVRWDASHVASGIYFYRIVAGNFSDVKKMIIVK